MTLQIGGRAVPVDTHPDIVLLCVGLLLAYATLVRRYGPMMVPAGQPAVTRREVAAFTAGVMALWLASGSPIHDLADQYLFSFHMVQHMLQGFVIAPLLIFGMPGWMLEVVTSPRWLRSFVRTFGKPLLAGIIFNGFLLGMHWPAVVTLMVENSTFHAVVHIILVLSSLLMWLPIASKSPAVQPRMNPLPRLGYVFAQTLLPTIPASFLTFGDPATPVFPVYAQFPRLWEISVGEDMLIAGLIMKTGGGFLLWGIIATLFFRWASDNERREAAERAARRRIGPAEGPSPA